MVTPLLRAIGKTIASLAALCALHARAETLILPPADVDLAGHIQHVEAAHEDTLLDIARRFDIGQDEIVLANPEVDRWLPGAGTRVIIPSRYILPSADRTGIVLNVPEMRLYFFPPQSEPPGVVQTYPVSIGRMDWNTPLGRTAVASKTRNPSWHPPESIRLEAAASGEPLPEVIPPGPDNPLGNYALRLARPGYLIHSTNRPFGVGMRVTHGCIRMYPEDIEVLFPAIPVGTRVEIVNQPIKLGWLFDTLFIEVHPPLEEHQVPPELLLETAMDLVNAAWQQRPFVLDGHALQEALRQQRGIPVPITQGSDD